MTQETISKYYLKDGGSWEDLFGVPSAHLLVKAIQRKRKLYSFPVFHELNSELNYEFLPEGFLRSDIIKDDARSLVFFTQHQYKYLSDQFCWYIDATFKLVKKPWMQLLSINCCFI